MSVKRAYLAIIFSIVLVLSSGVAIFGAMSPPLEYHQRVKWLSESKLLTVDYAEKNISIVDADGNLINSMKLKNFVSNVSASPDGDKITYYVKGEGFFISKIDGTRNMKISGDQPKNIQWSPDGKKIIFSVIEFSNDPGQRQAITYIVNADGSGKKEIIRKTIEDIPVGGLLPNTTSPAVDDTEAK